MRGISVLGLPSCLLTSTHPEPSLLESVRPVFGVEISLESADVAVLSFNRPPVGTVTQLDVIHIM